jgi:hypothetical protein
MNLKIFLTVDYESSLMQVHIGMEQIVYLIVEIPSNDVLGCAPAIILLFSSSKVRIFPKLEELPPKIILHFITECSYA